MSITFQVRVHPGYVELEGAGTYSPESTLQVFEQAFEIAAREGRGAVLLDARQVTGGPPTLMDRYISRACTSPNCSRGLVHGSDSRSSVTSR